MSDLDQALDNLQDRPGYALKLAADTLHRAMDNAVRPQGVSIAQYACLEVLARNPGASNSDLARGAFVTRQAAHQVVRRLIEDGLVSRSSDPAHGRRQILSLTPLGERRRRAAAALVDGIEERIRNAVPPDSVDLYTRCLRVTAAALSE